MRYGDDDDTERLAQAIEAEHAKGEATRRKRGVSVEWADRIERKLDTVLGLLGYDASSQSAAAGVEHRDGRRFASGTGWLDEDTHRGPPVLEEDYRPTHYEPAARPEVVADAIAAARQRIDRPEQSVVELELDDGWVGGW